MLLSDACITATFMATGMAQIDHASRKKGPDGYWIDVYSVWDQGAVELHSELSEYAVASEKIVDFLVEKNKFDFPGVYDYEVSEPFGMWFASMIFDNGTVPTKEAGLEKLIDDIAEFFSQNWEEPDRAGHKELIVQAIKENLDEVLQ